MVPVWDWPFTAIVSLSITFFDLFKKNKKQKNLFPLFCNMLKVQSCINNFTRFLIMLFVSVSVYGLKAERPFNRCLFYFSQSMRVLSHWFVISQNGDSKVAQTWHHMAGFMLIFFRSPPSRYAHTHHKRAHTHITHTLECGGIFLSWNWIWMTFGGCHYSA